MEAQGLVEIQEDLDTLDFQGEVDFLGSVVILAIAELTDLNLFILQLQMNL